MVGIVPHSGRTVMTTSPSGCSERGQLLHELGSDYGGHAVDVAGRVIFDDVGADDRPLYAVQDRQDVADREAARLVVETPGAKAGSSASRSMLTYSGADGIRTASA